MSEEKDEDLETLTESCENEVEPKAKQYKKAGENDKRRKKERTPAQIAAFEKCRAKREENRLLRLPKLLRGLLEGLHFLHQVCWLFVWPVCF